MDRYVKWILLASLLVNAILVGFIVGQAGRGGPMAAFSRRSMPPERRADETTRFVLKDTFEAERAALEAATKDAVDARRESIEILRSDPLDMARLESSLAKLRASSSATQESFHRALSAAAVKLNAQQRVALGRMLDRAPSGRIGNMRGPISGALSDIVTGRKRESSRGPVSDAVVDIVNGPPSADAPAPLPDGMGLGAPVPPKE